MKTFTRRIILIMLCSFAGLISGPSVNAQSGLCDTTVPFFTVNLTGQPAGTWISPLVVRLDHCCGTTSPDLCLEFEITTDTFTAAINFYIDSGSIPSGAMYYQINCGPPVAVGTPVCLTGTGPHTLTFCKPGTNPNTYGIFGIPAPMVLGDSMASMTNPATIYTIGFDESTLTWTEITYGGLYNSYLSATSGEDTVTVTPGPGFPPYIDILVCGDVLVPECFSSIYFCDTLRVYLYDTSAAGIGPNPASSCRNDDILLCYPNPSTGKFMIEVNDPGLTAGIITIYSARGKIVFREFTDKPVAFKRVINLDEAAAGIYYIMLETGEKKVVRKIAVE